MTQTTAERLLAIIGMNYRIIQHGDTRIADHSKAAEIIAAEIIALRDEMAVILRERNDAHLAQAEARATIANGREQRNLDRITIAAQADVIDERNTQLSEARAVNQSITNANHRFTSEIDALKAEIERVINANDDERRADAEVIAALKDEVAKLKPYALVQIAKLKRDSAIEELDGAEDEEERRQCARDLGDWHEMAFRATNLMREQWERDRKTMVRVELGDMVKAACL